MVVSTTVVENNGGTFWLRTAHRRFENSNGRRDLSPQLQHAILLAITKQKRRQQATNNGQMIPGTMKLSVLILLLWGYQMAQAFAPTQAWTMRSNNGLLASTKDMFFADTTTTAGTGASTAAAAEASKPLQKERSFQTRELGSQENLMLPRQYSPSDVTFPAMNHVAAVRLSATPAMEVLRTALEKTMAAHPLLKSHVQGDGEPENRIDLFQMVREGDPNPTIFVAPTGTTTLPPDTVSFISTDNLEQSWKTAFGRDLDDGSWCTPAKGPLWKLELHTTAATDAGDDHQPCVLLFSFNHAISDQSSVHRLVDQILDHLVALETSNNNTGPPLYQVNDMPVSLEESVLGLNQRWKDVGPAGFSVQTAAYVAGKAAEGLKNPVILPDDNQDRSIGSNNALGALSIISGQTAGGQDDATTRRSVLAFRKMSQSTVQPLLEACRVHGVSISNVLTAAATYTASDYVGGTPQNEQKNKNKPSRNYKVLQSLDMRRFGAQLDKGETLACMAGSHDLMHGPIPDHSGQDLRQNPTTSRLERFWELAQEGKQQTQRFFDSNGPSEAVRVFDFAMSISDLNNLVHLTAQSKDTKGRAYSVGVTNVGVYENQQSFPRADGSRPRLKLQHGKYRVEDIYFATPHTQSGCLFQVSCLTLDGELSLTFNPVAPIVSNDVNQKFADAFVELLEVVAGTKKVPLSAEAENDTVSFLKENALPLVAFLVGSASVVSHAPAWADFFGSVMEMKANTEPEQFWPALNFWIFFAVGHPILSPILWISDVLHGTPGPMIGGLVPALFVVGNLAAIAAVSFSKQLRNSVNIAAVAAFLTYVGAGLDGQAGLGDYNLALDDKYQGQVVKGCPAYDEVRQASMDDFDLKKYQGLWYEQKFHDWTQFKEVYDTSLDIKLTKDGDGWIDDFAVKGPAPDAAPLSWDKSPVANGAHYFLFGRVDKNDPPGILREKGFGVEFPNYIVDVQKDPESGEYKEAIQFQCLERGGVRVFEGINFMSRHPTMSDEEMAAMHARAEKAGMYPYGASPDQMHSVARRPVDSPPIDNNWQRMWSAIGVDQLLELLTKSIEDGGR